MAAATGLRVVNARGGILWLTASVSHETIPGILCRHGDLVAVDKPSGWIVHPGWARGERTVMQWLRDRIGQYVYPIHRLDRGTSGVLLFATSSDAAAEVGRRFADGVVEKTYVALVRGPVSGSGTVDHPIPKGERGGERVPAVTHWRALATVGRYSLLELRPITGRLHQIRRHLKHQSWPIIGDVRYGKGEHNRLFREQYELHRLALHCTSVAGVLDERITAPIGDDLAGSLRLAGFGAILERIDDRMAAASPSGRLAQCD